MIVAFFAAGTPKQMGSKSARVIGDRAVMFEQAKGLRPWRRDVEAAANVAYACITTHEVGEPIFGRDDAGQAIPVEVRLSFWMPRPKTVHRWLPTVKPDIDKLARAVLDCLTRERIYQDDAQVTRLVVEKQYAHQGAHDGSAGVEVRVLRIEKEKQA